METAAWHHQILTTITLTSFPGRWRVSGRRNRLKHHLHQHSERNQQQIPAELHVCFSHWIHPSVCGEAVMMQSEHCFLCLIPTRGILMRVFIGVLSEQRDEKRQTKSCRWGKSLLTFTQMTFLLPADYVSVCRLSIMDQISCWPSVCSFLCSTCLQIFTVNQQNLRLRHLQEHQGVSLSYYDTQMMHLP